MGLLVIPSFANDGYENGLGPNSVMIGLANKCEFYSKMCLFVCLFVCWVIYFKVASILGEKHFKLLLGQQKLLF